MSSLDKFKSVVVAEDNASKISGGGRITSRWVDGIGEWTVRDRRGQPHKVVVRPHVS